MTRNSNVPRRLSEQAQRPAPPGSDRGRVYGDVVIGIEQHRPPQAATERRRRGRRGVGVDWAAYLPRAPRAGRVSVVLRGESSPTPPRSARRDRQTQIFSS